MEIIVILAIIAGLVLLETVLYNRLGAKNLEYRITLSKNEVFEGEEIELTEEIYNAKRLALSWIKSELSTSSWLEFVGTQAQTKSELRFVPSVFSLGAFQKCTRKWRVKCNKRGVFELNNTTLTGTDLFGLIHFSVNADSGVRITVLPTPLDADCVEAFPDSLSGDTIVRRFICPDPFFIAGSREYTGKEPLHSFHWQNTARKNEPMVYSNEFTTDSSTLVLLDIQKSGNALTPLRTADAETLIKGAAFVFERLYENNLSYSFGCNFTEKAVPVLLASNSHEHYYESLCLLSELECVCRLPLDAYLQKLDYSLFSDVIVITADLDAQTLSSLKANIPLSFSVLSIRSVVDFPSAKLKIPQKFLQ